MPVAPPQMYNMEPYQMQGQPGPGMAYGSPYNYNPSAQYAQAQGGFQQQYYPVRNQNPYQPGYIQSNYVQQSN